MKKYLAVFMALALATGMAGVALAGQAQAEKEGAKGLQTESWQADEPVETGAVPGMGEKSKPSLIDTHYDPFHPELREIDRVGSTGG